MFFQIKSKFVSQSVWGGGGVGEEKPNMACFSFSHNLRYTM